MLVIARGPKRIMRNWYIHKWGWLLNKCIGPHSQCDIELVWLEIVKYWIWLISGVAHANSYTPDLYQLQFTVFHFGPKIKPFLIKLQL